MTFSGGFGRVFRPVFDPGLAAAAVPWYRAGGASLPVAAYQPKGAASLAASYTNLANPGTYDAAPGVAPTLGAAGWTFNGSTQYLITGVTPANDQTWSAIVQFSGATTTGDRVVLGGADAVGPRFYFALWVVSGGKIWFDNGAEKQSTTNAVASGNLAVAGTVGYLNGAIDTTGIGIAGPFAGSIFIGAYNIGGPIVHYTGNIHAVAIYNTTLTAPQVVAVSAAMAAL